MNLKKTLIAIAAAAACGSASATVIYSATDTVETSNNSWGAVGAGTPNVFNPINFASGWNGGAIVSASNVSVNPKAPTQGITLTLSNGDGSTLFGTSNPLTASLSFDGYVGAYNLGLRTAFTAPVPADAPGLVSTSWYINGVLVGTYSDDLLRVVDTSSGFGDTSGRYTVRQVVTLTPTTDLTNFQLTSTVSNVPEPATLAILGIGAAAFGLAGRRRKAAVAA